MKQLLTIIALFTFVLCNAQTIKVTYSEKMDLSEKLKTIDNPMIKQMIIEKTSKPKYYELIYFNGVSIYQKKSIDSENNDEQITMIGGGEKNIIYRNHNQNIYVRQTDFMSRTFLIEDKLQKNDWKITEDTLRIGEYLCKKAILKKGNNKVTAWFTGEIPSSEGPKNYYGLPGLILNVKIGFLTIEAIDITITKEKTTIQKPIKGKKVTQKEFEKIRQEKMGGLIKDKKQSGDGFKFIKM